MLVEITLTARAAAGKSHLASYFQEAILRFETETGQKVNLIIHEKRLL